MLEADGEKKKISHAIALISILFCLIIVIMASIVWYPPFSQKEYAPLAEAPFFLADASGVDKVNINTATAEELMVLPGIGEKRAMDIVSWREQHGFFESAEALTAISGIGAKTIENIAQYIIL